MQGNSLEAGEHKDAQDPVEDGTQLEADAGLLENGWQQCLAPVKHH